MRRKAVVAAIALAALAIGVVCYAQRPRGRGRVYGGGFYGIRRADRDSFTGDFTFCRIAYRQAPDGDGYGWGVDYPRADQNLPIRFSELTKGAVNFDENGDPNYFVMQAIEPEMFECPFVMLSEPGGAFLSDEEAKSLRAYMLKGGILWADDFWGEYAWAHWERQVRKIFPESSEYPIVDVPIEHAMFHTLFDVKTFPQIPGIGLWPAGGTSERGANSATPHARAILDSHGRIMLFMSHNTDFGDGYEREGDDPSYFYEFSVPGYAIGIDFLLYAMTH